MLHKTHTGIVAAVKVNGTDQGFKGISAQVTVVRRAMPIGQDELVYTHLLRQFVERVALYQLGAGIGEETLAFAGEVVIHYIANDGIQDGVAKKFKPLVVHRLAFLVTVHDALMHQGHLVVTNVVGVETYNLV